MTESVAIVIPCYNEHERFDAPAFLDFAGARDNLTFILVDDGSTDQTIQILSSLADGNPDNFSVLKLDRNRGKAEAVRQGLLSALELQPGLVGYWDADLATPLSAIDDLSNVFAAKPDLEMVVGSRVKLLGRNIQRNAVRHYLGRFSATAISHTLNLPIYDSQCGAKLFRAGPLAKNVFSQPFISNWVFDVEIMARYKVLLARTNGPQLADIIYEYPLQTWVDVAGSKIKWQDFLQSFIQLMKIKRTYLNGRSRWQPVR